jgi:hypothetical protein
MKKKTKPDRDIKSLTVDFPNEVFCFLHIEARRIGVDAQDLVKLWVGEYCDKVTALKKTHRSW